MVSRGKRLVTSAQSLGTWLPTFGQARISEALSKPYSFIRAAHVTLSKQWIVDRATLNQARVEDLSYVNDPEHLEFLAIYFANGTPQNETWLFSNITSISNYKTGQKAAI